MTKDLTKWIRFLNRLLKTDRQAITDLLSRRVRCNKKLAEHPTVQCGLRGGIYRVGVLGLLNGFLGADADGWGFLCAFIDDKTGKILRFGVTPKRRHKTSGFEAQNPKP